MRIETATLTNEAIEALPPHKKAEVLLDFVQDGYVSLDMWDELGRFENLEEVITFILVEVVNNQRGVSK